MSFNLSAIFAAISFSIMILLVAAFVYLQATKNTFKVGDKVRTTFSACPTVLNVALYGTSHQFSTSALYGPNYDQDTANSLHCDVHGGLGTYSSWLLNGGQNFKNDPSIQDVQMYFSSVECATDGDCSRTNVACGPGFKAPDHTASQWSTTPGTHGFNYAWTQCPGKTHCSLCTGSDGYDCRNVVNQGDIGQCVISNTGNYPLRCASFPDGKSYCSAVLSPDSGAPPFKRFNSCTPGNNYSSNTRCTESFTTYPYWCSLTGNPECGPGQMCVHNWGFTYTGYSLSTDTPTPSSYSDYVCSGTVLPTVPLNTTWIAEGTIAKVNDNGAQKTYNIEWNAVQNTYDKIGPSADFFKPGVGDEKYTDWSWIYSDCRFLYKSSYSAGRHGSVSQALLGTSISNPLGLGIFSITDASLSNYYIESALWVGSSTGSISKIYSNDFSILPSYRRSAWNLRSLAVPASDLTKLYFWSIHDMNYNSNTVQWFKNSQEEYFARNPI